MVAILLCAGFGTRLYPITRKRPNALLDIAGRPVLDYQMDQLCRLKDLTEIHVVVNSRFAAHFYTWWRHWRPKCEEHGITLMLHNDGSVNEESRLGEVGDLAFVARLIDASQGVIVSAGDNIYRFSIGPVVERFCRTDESLVLAFPETHHAVLQQHTVIDFDKDGRLTQVYDKPDDPPSQWVCANLYFLQPPALALVDEFLKEAGERDRLAHFLDYLVEHVPVRAIEMNRGSMRLHINTRYMYEKAKETLSKESVLLE